MKTNQNPQIQDLAEKHAQRWHDPESAPDISNLTPPAPARAQHSPLAISNSPTEKSAGYSPLPWTALANTIVTVGIPGKGAIATLRETPCEGGLHLSPEIAEANAVYIVRACNNAQRLADALAIAQTYIAQGGSGADQRHAHVVACEALAQWEGGAQ